MRWMVVLAIVTFVAGLASAQDWDAVQSIPAFFDCRDGRDTHIIVTCHSQDVVRYGWTMYNAYGEIVQSWHGTAAPGSMKLWVPKRLLEEDPAGFEQWDIAWGLFVIDVIDDPSHKGSLSVTVAYYDSEGWGIGRQHIAQLPLAHESDDAACRGAFYRATPTSHTVLTVVNVSSEDVEFTVSAFDLSGELILEEDGYLLPFESDYYVLRELVPQPPTNRYQGVLKVAMDAERSDSLLLVLSHWYEAELYRQELLP